MSDTPNSLFSALISVPSDGERAEILGKSSAERQLEFALEAGCGRIVLLGYGGSEDAIRLRHRAESAGMKCVIVSGAHAVAALSQDGGNTLIFQDGVVPASLEALSAFAGGGAILVVPAGLGSELGYERIDLARSWAGALVLNDNLLVKLLDLPEDIETAPALLRIALQAGLAEEYLAEEELVSGGWSLLGHAQETAELEEKWLGRHFDTVRGKPSQRLAAWIVRRLAGRLRLRVLHMRAVRGLSLLAGAGGVAASYAGFGAAGFALIALAVLLLEGSRLGDRLRLLPFGSAGKCAMFALALDLAIVGTGYFAIDWGWLHKLFPPLVLFGVLHIPADLRGGALKDWLDDRALLAVILAIGAALGLAEQAIMAVCLLLLLGKSSLFLGKRG